MFGTKNATPGIERVTSAFGRALVVAAPVGSVSDCLICAIQQEFPWISVEQVDCIKDACGSFDHPVSLILVDPSLLDDLDLFCGEVSLRHPAALMAVMYDDAFGRGDAAERILASRTVRGVLPMNLKLDLWLSIIRLMLRGGEYFPSSLFQARTGFGRNGEALYNGHGPEKARKGGLKTLTEREIQILEMVSHGLQNKLIAAKFKLSEYTVKVHLHHIIKKLGAQNRTAAAAIFLEGARFAGSGGAGADGIGNRPSE
ncbi:response regulator transcription factor [Pseudaminobacter sp. NGMCC 1.201702]|uniref:response regulator transcription factor n=1 Tax=Pseudaminobacter sp. NGMCC 1.201702 TaxID=3391825 RepID=UPI0039F0D294